MNDPTPVLITFALPDESRDLVRALADPVRLRHRDHLSPVSGVLFGHSIVVLHTGVGDSAACQQRFTDLLRIQRPRFVISAGYAGGLDPDLRVGDLLVGENYSSPTFLTTTRAALANLPFHVGPLTTQTVTTESVAAKSALHASTRAIAVDMETAWISAACADIGNTPLLSLRVISDAADQSFPVPGHILFDARRQSPRYVALPLYLLTHPSRIAHFVAFVRALPSARARLTHALVQLIHNEFPV